MTAHALVEERQRCLDAGMNDHVSKPIDPDVLFATLLRWVHPSTVAAAAPAAPQPTGGEIVIPDIEDVDVTGGVKRVAGNKRLYRDLLGQFVEKHAAAAEDICEALKADDKQLAERIAHTVKGVAGNLGIASVQSSAATLEKAIREGDPEISARLAEFGAIVEKQVRAIAVALEAGAPVIAKQEHSSFDPQAASTMASRLKELLDSSDGESDEAFTAFRNAIGSVAESSSLDALGAAIRDYDFDSATAQLAELVQELSLNDRKVTA